MDDLKFKGIALTDGDREFSKNFGEKGGTFTIRIPLPSQKMAIVSNTSRLLGGASLDSISAKDYEYARMIATLDFVITKNPDWWQGVNKCPDDSFLLELWKFYIESEESFFEKLRKL